MMFLITATAFLLAVPPAAQAPAIAPAQTPAPNLIQPIPANITFAPANPSLPSIFIVGDSTANGWGPQAVPFFDTSKVNVVLAAASGRSSRTFLTEGIWARVLLQIRPHDVVLLQFGHNDAGNINDATRARGSLHGIGDDTQEIDNQVTHQHEVVHTYGWYMRQFIHDVKAKDATPILLSLTPHNEWKDGHMVPDPAGFVGWTSALAQQEHVDYVDINRIAAAQFEALGEAKSKDIYLDAVHLKGPNWLLFAAPIVSALKTLPDAPITRFLSAKGREISTAADK